MALTRISNELYMDFELLGKVYQERFKRGLTFSRLQHSPLIKLCQETTLDEQVNEIERSENKVLNCVNFKKQ